MQQHSILFCWPSIYRTPPPNPPTHPPKLGCQAAASHLQSQISPKMLIKFSIFKQVNGELFKHQGKMVDSNLKCDPSDCKLLVYLCFICSTTRTNALILSLWDALMPKYILAFRLISIKNAFKTKACLWAQSTIHHLQSLTDWELN